MLGARAVWRLSNHGNADIDALLIPRTQPFHWYFTRDWFPLVVVLPLTVIAVCSAAILCRLVDEWPAYPKPLEG